MTVDHLAEAERILAARRRAEPIEPISDRLTIDMDDAYAIQRHVVADRLAAGGTRIGWKLGYTSAAMRAQMGIASPNFGPLTSGMLVGDGDDVGDRFVQPRVEPEVALRFAADVPVGADRTAVLDAVASAHAALEIVDSIWLDYRFQIEDNTADGSSAAGVVLGGELPLDAIADVEVVLTVDGAEAGRGIGSDASGHPADGVVWLVDQLAARGERLRAGDLVITGGLTAAPYLHEGTVIAAVFDTGFDTGVRVSVRRGRTPADTVGT